MGQEEDKKMASALHLRIVNSIIHNAAKQITRMNKLLIDIWSTQENPFLIVPASKDNNVAYELRKTIKLV